jgi:NhaP-type Na+/H+ or K+/H+ antiporter
MTVLGALQFFGYSVGISAVFGAIFGFLYFWLPKNIN